MAITPLRIPFSTEDLRTPEGTERVLRDFQKAVDIAHQAASASPVAISQALLDKLSAQIRDQLQAGGRTPLNLQSLLPTGIAGANIIEDTHANRIALYTPPAAAALVLWEIDRTVLYISTLSSGSIVWTFSAGRFTSTLANRPADLGTNDIGFQFLASDTAQHFRWTGAAWFEEYQVNDSVTNTVTNILNLVHRSSGTPAANFGASLGFQLDSSTNVLRNAGFLDTIWTTATNASETSAMVFRLMNAGAGAAEVMRVRGDGSVGIGTTSPSQLLSVGSGSPFTVDSSGNIITSATAGIGVASTGGINLSVKGADSTIATLISGASKAVRFFPLTTAMVLEGVDNTGAGSYQPLTIGGLQVNISNSGTTFAQFISSGFVLHGALAQDSGNFTSNGNIGFFGASAQTQQASGANLTNNVTAGGTTDQIDDFTSLTVYATDAATIRNDIYQLARKVKQINDAMRLYGLLT